jgi:hypothetical protein
MSEDARNSLTVWGWALAMGGLFWLSARFDLAPHLPKWLTDSVLLVLTAQLLWKIVRHYWRSWRKAGETD